MNGTLKEFFIDCEYIGIDVGKGDNVDVVCLAGDYNELDESFDTIVSAATFEHDKEYKKSFKNIIRLLKKEGLFTFCCASTGYTEHCTPQTGGTLPCSELFGNYYRNISEEDVRKTIPVDLIFKEYEFKMDGKMLSFWGIKK